MLFLSHVIEHLADPWTFLEEARSTAAKVYLEFLWLVRELMYAWPYHRRLVRREGRTLMFHANDVAQQFGDSLREQYDILFDVWSTARHEQRNALDSGDPRDLESVRDERSAVEYVADRSPRDADHVDHRGPGAQEEVGRVHYPCAARLKPAAWSPTPQRVLRRHAARARPRDRGVHHELTPEMTARLLCPACCERALELVHEPVELCCAACGKRYREKLGVFDLDREPASVERP